MRTDIQLLISYDREADSVDVQIVQPGDPPMTRDEVNEILGRAHSMLRAMAQTADK